MTLKPNSVITGSLDDNLLELEERLHGDFRNYHEGVGNLETVAINDMFVLQKTSYARRELSKGRKATTGGNLRIEGKSGKNQDGWIR